MKTIVLISFSLFVCIAFGQITPFKFEIEPESYSDLLKKEDVRNFMNDTINSKKQKEIDSILLIATCKMCLNDKNKTKKICENHLKKREKIIEKKGYKYLSLSLEVYHAMKTKELVDSIDKLQMALNIDPTNNPQDLKKMNQILENQKKDSLKEIDEYLDLSREFNYLSYIHKAKFIPVLNHVHAQMFYNSYVSEKKYQFAENNNFTFNTQGQRVSGMTELYADYFGPFRVSFGALLSNGKSTVYYDSTGVAMTDSAGIQLDATQRFLGGGGNAIMNLSFPLFNYTHRNDAFHVKAMFSPKYSFDVPALGSFIDEPTANLEVGVDFSVFYTGALNTLTFYAFNRIGYADGTSLFYSNLNLKERQGFFTNQLTLGMAIKSIFRISYTIYTVSDENLKTAFKPMIGFAVIPQ